MNSLNGNDFLYNATLRGTTKTDSLSEDTPAAGVTIDGVKLKDGGATLATITAPAASLIIKPTTDATTAVQIADKDGTVTLNVDTSGNNVSIGTPGFGTSAAKVLAMGNGTAPTAIIANGIQVWSADYAAGDARLYIMGEASTSKVAIGNGEVVIPDAGGFVIQPNLTTDHTYCALEKIPSGTAGENLVFGDSCYLAADLKWYKADSSTSATMPAKAIALATIAAASTGAFLKRGYIRDDSRWAAMTVGQDIYPSETAGSLTQTAPVPTTSATVMLQTVGHAPSTNTATVGIIWFDPSSNYTEIGVDVIDFGTDHAVNIALSDLTTIPLTYQGNDADNQTATITSQPVAADVGKEFRVVKKGTGAGTMIVQAPANTYFVNSAGASTAAGTITSEASKYQSVHCKVISTTEILILCSDGTWTKSS